MSLKVQRQAGVAGVVGGLLWAMTPLRQPIFGAGRTPEQGETFFRSYNLVLIIIAILLTVALFWLRQTRPVTSRLFALGWWIILVGHGLILVGSFPAVVFGDQRRDLVMGGQDVGFLGAMTAALGGLLVGVSVVLSRRRAAGLAYWLLLLTLPLGLTMLILLTTRGAPEDYLGLPLTVLYGGAWIVFGSLWLSQRTTGAIAPAAGHRRKTG